MEKKPERRRFRQETVIHSYITRPLSIEICRLIWSTRITPNQITLLRAIFNLLSLILFSFGNLSLAIVGFILFHVHEILDCVDGLYARLKGLASKKGAYLENVLDTLFSTSYGFLGLSLVIGAVVNGSNILAIFFFLYVFLELLSVSTTNSISNLSKNTVVSDNQIYIPIIDKNKLNIYNLIKTIYIWKNEVLLGSYIFDLFLIDNFIITTSVYVLLSLLIIGKFCKKIRTVYEDIRED